MKEFIHTQIHSPLEIRKKILRSTLDSLSLLKSYESLKEIREEKQRIKARLKSNCSRINGLMIQLQKDLPKIKIPTEKIIKSKLIEEKEIKKEKLTGAEKLSQELFDIQSKLNKLEI